MLRNQVDSLLSTRHHSPGSSTTSSTGSSKSKQETELETKIARLDSIVSAQMAMMASMQKTMELLTLKMTTHETLLTQEDQDNESVRKRHKQGPGPMATVQDRNGHPSNTGTDSPAAEPPDPGQRDTAHTQRTNTTSESNQSMESVESEINGGITDADLSIAMQDDAIPQSPTFEPSSPIDTLSPTAINDDEL